MTALVENLLPLAPALLALVGAAVVGVVWWRGRARRLPIDGDGGLLVSLGEGFLALALGVTIRLAIVAYREPSQTFDPFGALGVATLPFPAILGVSRLDLLALMASALVLVLAIGALISASATAPRTIVGLLLATAAALYAVVSPAPISLGLAWTALALAPVLDRRLDEPQPDESATGGSTVADWVLFGVAAFAIFFFADAALAVSGGALLGDQSAPRGVPALLILLAVSAAGIGPLGGVVRRLAQPGDAVVGRFVVRLLAIVGFLLAVRVLFGNAADGSSTSPTLLLRGLLTILVFWSVGEALVGQLTRVERLTRGLLALAFLVLSLLSVPLIFLGFGVLTLGSVIGVAGGRVLGTGQARAPLIAVPDFGLREWQDELAFPDVLGDGVRDLASLLRQVEDRYDLAVGLLLALAVVSAFAR